MRTVVQPTAPLIVFASLLGILGILQLAVLMGSRGDEIQIEDQSALIDKTWLPETSGGWELAEYVTEERDRSSDEGQRSSIWCYASGQSVAQVSVDYPFLGWHELSNCYTGRGWKQMSRKVISPDNDPEGSNGPGSYVQVELSGPSGESGFLLFSLFDAAGNPVPPRTTHWNDWRVKISKSPLIASLTGKTIAASQTTMQVQQFVVENSPLPETERQVLHQMFLGFRDAVRERRLAAINSSENADGGR